MSRECSSNQYSAMPALTGMTCSRKAMYIATCGAHELRRSLTKKPMLVTFL